MPENGGAGKLEAAVGEEMCQVGMVRSVGLVLNVLEQVEDVVGDAFVVSVADLEDLSVEDLEGVERVKGETA